MLTKGTDLLAQRKLHEAQVTLQIAARKCPMPQVFATLGLSYDLASRHKEAQQAFRKAISLDPNVPGFHNNLGISYFSSGNYAAGIAEFQKALAINPNDPSAGINLGKYYLQRKEFSRAESRFLAAGVLKSRDPVALLELATASFGAHNLKTAHAAASQLSAIAGKNAKIRFSLGLLLARNGDYKMAAREFSSIPPSVADFAVYLNMGMAYSKLQQFDQAQNAYKTALQLDPSSPEPFLHLGIDEASAGKHIQAVDWLSQAYAKAPAREDIAYAFVEELIQTGNYSWAQTALSRALKFHPRAAELVEAQGDLFLAQKQDEQAKKAYLQCLDTDPQRIGARLSLAKAYTELGQSNEAHKQLEKVIQLQPGNAEAEAQLGRMAFKAGNTRTAMQLIESALRHDPDNRMANEDLAEISVREGNYSQAFPALERLVKLEPRVSKFHYLLGRVLLKLGRRTDAEREFQLSVKLQAAPPASSSKDGPTANRF